MEKIDFSKWTHPDAERLDDYLFANGHLANVFNIKSIHALNQFVGYVKYKCMQEKSVNVFFRGQSELYKTLMPSIFRFSANDATGKDVRISIARRYENLRSYIKDCETQVPCLKKLNQMTTEALLQHYGIKTSWLDIVDNLWVALWFSIHNSKLIRSDNAEYEHISLNNKEQKVYLLLIRSDAVSAGTNGCYKGTETELVDLRLSAPSFFLRPHAQHALLIRSRKRDSQVDVDLAKNVCAILSFDINNVKSWLGEGKLLSAENIYPPAIADQGYRILLENAPRSGKEKTPTYGFVTSISYSI